MPDLHSVLTVAETLPNDADRAVLVGRVWVEGLGPVLARVTPDGVFDLSQVHQQVA